MIYNNKKKHPENLTYTHINNYNRFYLSVEESNQAVDENEAALDEIARNYATMTIENLRSQVSSEIRYRGDIFPGGKP